MKATKTLLAGAAFALLAGGSVMAQSQVTVNATPVAGEKNTYTLNVVPFNTTMETALNDLKGSSTRSMLSSVVADKTALTFKVVVSDPNMTEENLEIYLRGYLDYKSRNNGSTR